MKKRGRILLPIIGVTAILLTLFTLLPTSTETTSEAFSAVPAVAPPVNPHQEALLASFEARIDSIMQEHDVPALAIAIVRNNEIIYEKALGHKKIHTNDEINIHTKFRLASASKGFSAILAGLLVKEGYFDWDDHISTYLSEFTPQPMDYSDSLTIGTILSQSSGFPYQAYSNLVEDGFTLDQLILALSQIKLVSRPGKIYSYQNVAYSVIEPIIKATTGEDYQTMIKSRIFEPMGMVNTTADFETMRDDPNSAVPHRRTRFSYAPIKLSPSYYNVAAAGGINASIDDMAQWLRLLLGYRPDVVPLEVLEQVFTPRVRTPLMNRYYRKWVDARRAYYGLGWRIVPTPTDTLVYHGGYANGFKSHVALDRNSHVGICILSNSSDNLVNEAGPMFLGMFHDYEELIDFWDKSLHVGQTSVYLPPDMETSTSLPEP